VLTGVLLLLTYLVFATPAQWTLYYYESVPAYAFLTASGIGWAASLIGRPRDRVWTTEYSWRSPRWTRAIVASMAFFIVPGVSSLQMVRGQHIGDRKFLTNFYRLLGTINDPKAIVFVRYAGGHNPHVTFVRNTANLEGERIWVVYDRGEAENARLMSQPQAAGRKAYLFDEIQGKTYIYEPLAR
jgi:hypothetical protein